MQALPSLIINLTPNQTTSAQRYTPNTAEYIIPSKHRIANAVAPPRAQGVGPRGGKTGFATLSASPPRKLPQLKKQNYIIKSKTPNQKNFPTKNSLKKKEVPMQYDWSGR